jgi:tRNA pseudouridine-54 N-methylase
MESKIIKKIGDNQTDEMTFNNGIFVDEPNKNELLGFYTYEGEVYILDGLGMDVPFSDYSQKNKETIYKAIMFNLYE